MWKPHDLHDVILIRSLTDFDATKDRALRSAAAKSSIGSCKTTSTDADVGSDFSPNHQIGLLQQTTPCDAQAISKV